MITLENALRNCIDAGQISGGTVVLLEQGEKLLGRGADCDKGLLACVMGVLRGGKGGEKVVLAVECNDAADIDESIRSKFEDEVCTFASLSLSAEKDDRMG